MARGGWLISYIFLLWYYSVLSFLGLSMSPFSSPYIHVMYGSQTHPIVLADTLSEELSAMMKNSLSSH